METVRKMELQRRARDGLEARDLLAEKFGEAWLKDVETQTLSKLVKAKGVEELVESCVGVKRGQAGGRPLA